MRHVETAIIGSGPYGLSLAAHMRHRGLPFALFGQPMQSWKDFMPKGMSLKSERFASSLSDPAGAYDVASYCRQKSIHYEPTGKTLSRDVFLDYATWFQEKNELVSNGKLVTAIEKTSAGTFLLTVDDGETVSCRYAVLATGHMPYVSIPIELEKLSKDRMMHSAYLRDPAEFSGRRVIVVGAGQSALESAALLVESGAQVTVVARKGFLWNPPSEPHRSLWRRIRAPESGLAPGWRSLFYSEMPGAYRHLPLAYRHRVVATKWGPSGSVWLRDRLIGKATFMPHQTIVGADETPAGVSLRLSGPQGPATVEADMIIAATGFRADLDRLGMLGTELRAQIQREARVPKLNGSFETSVPNLFVMGMLSAPTFGPVMRFMCGAKHPAKTVSAQIAARHARSASAADTAVGGLGERA